MTLLELKPLQYLGHIYLLDSKLTLHCLNPKNVEVDGVDLVKKSHTLQALFLMHRILWVTPPIIGPTCLHLNFGLRLMKKMLLLPPMKTMCVTTPPPHPRLAHTHTHILGPGSVKKFNQYFFKSWFDDSYLNFNTKKYKCISISIKKSPTDSLHVVIKGGSIKQVTEE